MILYVIVENFSAIFDTAVDFAGGLQKTLDVRLGPHAMDIL